VNKKKIRIEMDLGALRVAIGSVMALSVGYAFFEELAKHDLSKATGTSCLLVLVVWLAVSGIGRILYPENFVDD